MAYDRTQEKMRGDEDKGLRVTKENRPDLHQVPVAIDTETKIVASIESLAVEIARMRKTVATVRELRERQEQNSNSKIVGRKVEEEDNELNDAPFMTTSLAELRDHNRKRIEEAKRNRSEKTKLAHEAEKRRIARMRMVTMATEAHLEFNVQRSNRTCLERFFIPKDESRILWGLVKIWPEGTLRRTVIEYITMALVIASVGIIVAQSYPSEEAISNTAFGYVRSLVSLIVLRLHKKFLAIGTFSRSTSWSSGFLLNI